MLVPHANQPRTAAFTSVAGETRDQSDTLVRLRSRAVPRAIAAVLAIDLLYVGRRG